ncbi:glycoside hydrolase family 97 protein [Mucilaginibacter gynuensis]|uniref:Glycoside hydrolase family 97 protein n=1 Tax=Mucilaginibacter gynuensis TaxID=1302236 RepID=A0ABP8G1W4_9SPHI
MVYKYILSLLLVSALITSASAQSVYSPDKKIVVAFKLKAGKPVYTVAYNKQPVINESALGIAQSNANLYSELTLKSTSAVKPVKDSYTMLNAKKSQISYTANQVTFSLANADKKAVQIIFNVSNDGVAFRYHFPGQADTAVTITKEYTAFNFAPSTKAWLQPKAEAQSGWEHTNPSYEEYYEQDIPVGKTAKNGWVYPALFKSGNAWLLITEANMDGTYCATHLVNDSASTVYHTGFPDARELFTGKGLLPKGAAYSPWRVITIGGLKTIVESTLGTDLAKPAQQSPKADYIKPGKAAWSWIMSKDDSITYTETIRYIDLAAKMKWQYCLVDVDWDTKIGYDKIKTLVDYGAQKNVGLLLWYNSAGPWNTVKYHPKDKLLTHEGREKEFARLQQMGIKGVKIDFFNGDGQSMIQYYIDILNDAAKYKLLVNFHGATLPRGWARTYPHLMSTEAVKGFEMVTFEQRGADMQANHCAMLPFTRNAFDPMDFTPVNLYKIPTQVIRKTSSGFELALSVLFLSGIQHYAESPEGMTHVPDFVTDMLKTLPDNWDDVKFIDGYPGKYVVIARKSGNTWYVAGINGEGAAKTLNLDLSTLNKTTGTIITDGKEPLSFSKNSISLPANKKINVTMQANGGFTMVLN